MADLIGKFILYKLFSMLVTSTYSGVK